MWRLGTMGYAYKEWLGVFYPDRLPNERWLKFYSEQFPAMELHTTFHATPPPERVRKWAETVPPEFRFAVKVGRHISHDGPLDSAVPLLAEFIRVMQNLGHRLGPLLLQLPPSTSIEQAPGLRLLLESVPRDVRMAVEFRHPGWQRPETADMLREFGAAMVALDHEEHRDQAVIHRTADFLYVRLAGRHGRYPDLDHEVFDPTPRLEEWWERLQPHLPHVNEAWVLFNNDYAGHGPATLRRFARIAGVPLPERPVRQQSLFD